MSLFSIGPSPRKDGLSEQKTVVLGEQSEGNAVFTWKKQALYSC